MRRGRRFQLLFDSESMLLIWECLEEARRAFSHSREKGDEELEKIKKLEHSFSQALAYDMAFKKMFGKEEKCTYEK